MKFMIHRTSMWDDAPPCAAAVREKFTRVDIRSVAKPEDVRAYKGQSADWWYNEGTNHRVINSCIARDFDDEGWFIEISSLEELLKFQEFVGNIIISQSIFNPEIKEIEIYDDYRE